MSLASKSCAGNATPRPSSWFMREAPGLKSGAVHKVASYTSKPKITKNAIAAPSPPAAGRQAFRLAWQGLDAAACGVLANGPRGTSALTKGQANQPAGQQPSHRNSCKAARARASWRHLVSLQRGDNTDMVMRETQLKRPSSSEHLDAARPGCCVRCASGRVMPVDPAARPRRGCGWR